MNNKTQDLDELREKLMNISNEPRFTRELLIILEKIKNSLNDCDYFDLDEKIIDLMNIYDNDLEFTNIDFFDKREIIDAEIKQFVKLNSI